MSRPDHAFGLDPSGYSTPGSALAWARRSAGGATEAVVLTGHPFARPRRGDDPHDPTPEIDALRACLERGPVCIDAPLDLLGLPDPPDVHYTWQLTRRPVDRTFGGMPALADRIGACVARLRPLIAAVGEERVGRDLFETYPAATLKRLGFVARGYKGRARQEAGGWVAHRDDLRDRQLAELLTGLGWTADDGFELGHDAFDAILCALTGLAREADLVDVARETEATMAERYPLLAPVRHARGYRLAQRLPEALRLTRAPWSGGAP